MSCLPTLIEERKERERERERKNVVDEVYKSELRLESALATLALFSEPLKTNGILTDDLRNRLFPPTLDVFFKISSKFAVALRKEMDQEKEWSVGELLLKHARDCAVLLGYCAGN
jgi:hypothetical protein